MENKKKYIIELEELNYDLLKSTDINELDKLQSTLAWTVFEYIKQMTLDINISYANLFEDAERVLTESIMRLNAKIRAIERIRNERELDVLGLKTN